jgi:hypothetical protein
LFIFGIFIIETHSEKHKIMEGIFPREIIRNTAESHFFKFSKKTSIIYSFTIVLLSIVFILLFFIKTEVTVLSRGLIRSAGEPVPITTPVNAEVSRTSIKENGFVKLGDTLLWLNKEKPDRNYFLILMLGGFTSEILARKRVGQWCVFRVI